MAVRLPRLPHLLRDAVVPDGDLLTRFLDLADTEALAELVRRHAGMVRGVCRRALGPTADADDAFQATFLVFVRKARTVSPRSQVGNFLYGVAYRTAVHARSARAARQARHRELPDMPATPVETADPDHLAALDEELARLPDAYRAAVVLCELEGLSLKEAAGRTRVPVGTLASRLARGRRLLADRLARRGLAGLLTALGGTSATAAAVPRKLLDQAVAGATAPAAELAHGVLKAMLLTKLRTLGKAAAGVLLAAGLLVVTATGNAAPNPRPNARRAPVPEAKDQKKLDELWEELKGWNARSTTSAALALARHPKAVEFLKQKLVPLKADKDEVKRWLADLSSDRPEVWKPVYEKMTVIDPLLAFGVRELFDLVPDDVGRSRLLGIWWNVKPDDVEHHSGLSISSVQRPDPATAAKQRRVDLVYTKKLPGGLPQTTHMAVWDDPAKVSSVHWIATERAVAILEQIGTPAAVDVLRSLATGHDEVLPTIEAKAALKRLGK